MRRFTLIAAIGAPSPPPPSNFMRLQTAEPVAEPCRLQVSGVLCFEETKRTLVGVLKNRLSLVMNVKEIHVCDLFCTPPPQHTENHKEAVRIDEN